MQVCVGLVLLTIGAMRVLVSQGLGFHCLAFSYLSPFLKVYDAAAGRIRPTSQLGNGVLLAPFSPVACRAQMCHVAASLSSDGAAQLFVNGALAGERLLPGPKTWAASGIDVVTFERTALGAFLAPANDSDPLAFLHGALRDARWYDFNASAADLAAAMASPPPPNAAATGRDARARNDTWKAQPSSVTFLFSEAVNVSRFLARKVYLSDRVARPWALAHAEAFTGGLGPGGTAAACHDPPADAWGHAPPAQAAGTGAPGAAVGFAPAGAALLDDLMGAARAEAAALPHGGRPAHDHPARWWSADDEGACVAFRATHVCAVRGRPRDPGTCLNCLCPPAKYGEDASVWGSFF